MIEKVVSYDDGFGQNKSVADGKTYVIPSFQGKFEDIPESDLTEKFEQPESHITFYDEFGIKKLVGFGALLNRKTIWDTQENKHISETRFYPLFHASLGLALQDESDDEIVLNPLVMSLPVDQVTDERKSELVKLVKKTHNIHIELADKTVVKKKVTVKSLIIKSQPFGSFAYKVMNNNGEIIDRNLHDKRTVVFDLGTRTLNVLTLEGFTELKGSSFVLQKGMFEAWSTLRDHIQQIEGLNLTVPVVKLIASTEEIVGKHGILPNGNDISKLRDKVYAEHTDELLSEFDSRNIDVKDEIDSIILTGGGSIVLKKWLEKGIKSRFPNAKIETLSDTANAEGLYRFGVRARNEMIRKQQVEAKSRQAQTAKNNTK